MRSVVVLPVAPDRHQLPGEPAGRPEPAVVEEQGVDAGGGELLGVAEQAVVAGARRSPVPSRRRDGRPARRSASLRGGQMPGGAGVAAAGEGDLVHVASCSSGQTSMRATPDRWLGDAGLLPQRRRRGRRSARRGPVRSRRGRGRARSRNASSRTRSASSTATRKTSRSACGVTRPAATARPCSRSAVPLVVAQHLGAHRRRHPAVQPQPGGVGVAPVVVGVRRRARARRTRPVTSASSPPRPRPTNAP